MTQALYAVTVALAGAMFVPPAVIDYPYWIRAGGTHAATPQRRLGPGRPDRRQADGRHAHLLRLLSHSVSPTPGAFAAPAPAAPTIGCLPFALPLTPAAPDPAAAAEALAHAGAATALSGPYSDSALPPDRQPDPGEWAAWWPIGGREPRNLTSPHTPIEPCDCPNPDPGKPWHCAAAAVAVPVDPDDDDQGDDAEPAEPEDPQDDAEPAEPVADYIAATFCPVCEERRGEGSCRHVEPALRVETTPNGRQIVATDGHVYGPFPLVAATPGPVRR